MTTRIIKFLKYQGWKYQEGLDGVVYSKVNCIDIEICKDELVLFDDTGDFLHLPLNYYALVGALVIYRQLPINFKEAPNDSR